LVKFDHSGSARPTQPSAIQHKEFKGSRSGCMTPDMTKNV